MKLIIVFLVFISCHFFGASLCYSDKKNNVNITQALISGNTSLLNEKDVFIESLLQAKKEYDQCNNVLNSIYPKGLKKITFPAKRVNFFTSVNPSNIPLFSAKFKGKSKTYAWMGKMENSTKYIVLGTNLFKQYKRSKIKNINKDFLLVKKRLFEWLLNNGKKENVFFKPLKILVDSNALKKELKKWLKQNKIENKWEIFTDLSLLNKQSFDLFLSKQSEHHKVYKQAIKQKTPVMIWKDWVKPDAEMLDYFGLELSGYIPLTVGSWDSVDEQCLIVSNAGKVFTLLNAFQEHKFKFKYDKKSCPGNDRMIKCKPNLLFNKEGKTLAFLFSAGAQTLRKQLAYLDSKNISVFKLESRWRLLKLLVLWSDLYREKIDYPLNKLKSKNDAFYKSYLSDHIVNYSWIKNQKQSDLGDFSSQDKKNKRDENKITAKISLSPTEIKQWTSTGYYIPAGMTIYVKREDHINAHVNIKFNMLRPRTTRLWTRSQYTRPAFLQSPEIKLEKNHEYQFSSPYGGPIYVSIKKDSIPLDSIALKGEVKLSFKNIYKHPMLNEFSKNGIKKFKKQMEDSSLDWIDIKTPFVEIHSQKDKMAKAIQKYNGDLFLYLNDIKKYLILSNISLAGFVGKDVTPLSNKVVNFCRNKKLNCRDKVIHKKPKVQHINSDIYASCGGLCSGNPFDSAYPILPLGWGESHEFGHNLQRKRLKVYFKKSNESSNNIFPVYTMQQYAIDHHLKNFGKIRKSQQSAYELLQNAIANKITASEDHPLWNGKRIYNQVWERLSFYLQLVYINNTWDIYTALYLIERLYSNALLTEKEWFKQRKNLGFSSYSWEEAKEIKGNDFIYISLSYFTKQNHKKYFNTWGISLTKKSIKQVNTNGYDEYTPLYFYKVDEKIYAKLPNCNKKIRLLDGKSTWTGNYSNNKKTWVNKNVLVDNKRAECTN